MQQLPPPQVPWHRSELPAGPAVVPMTPVRLRQPGRHAPQPDEVAVRRLPVPDAAPPYDDERPGTDEQPRGLESRLDEPPPPVAPPPAGELPAAEPATGEVSQTRQSGPDQASWPSQFAQVLAETLAGSRPARQLTPWTTEQARQRIRQLSPMLVSDQRPRVRRVVTSAPAQNVLELTAVVGFGPRVRALALRLERGQGSAVHTSDGRWCCTVIESA